MGHKIAVRVKPLKQWSDVSNATRHGKREDPAKHVDRTRTNLNEHWISEMVPQPDGSSKWMLNRTSDPVDISAAFKAVAERTGAKWRKGAIVGTEMLFIASPGFFGPPGPERDKKAAEWSRDCLRAAMKKYPKQIAAARLDLDETTPHFSIFLLPTYEKSYEGEARKSTRKPKKTISHNQVFGTPEKLTALQDWAAEAMKAAGHLLERGEPKTSKGPDHTTPTEGRRRITQAEEKAQSIVQAAEKAAEAILESAKGDAAKIVAEATPARFLALQKANAELEKENREYRAYLIDWKTKYELLIKQTKEIVSLDVWSKIEKTFLSIWRPLPKEVDKLQSSQPDVNRSSGMDMS